MPQADSSQQTTQQQPFVSPGDLPDVELARRSCVHLDRDVLRALLVSSRIGFSRGRFRSGGFRERAHELEWFVFDYGLHGLSPFSDLVFVWETPLRPNSYFFFSRNTFA